MFFLVAKWVKTNQTGLFWDDGHKDLHIRANCKVQKGQKRRGLGFGIKALRVMLGEKVPTRFKQIEKL